jgi:hypothetical protein
MVIELDTPELEDSGGLDEVAIENIPDTPGLEVKTDNDEGCISVAVLWLANECAVVEIWTRDEDENGTVPEDDIEVPGSTMSLSDNVDFQRFIDLPYGDDDAPRSATKL